MVRDSADPIQVLCGSCDGKSSGLSVPCVSHELHARKDEYAMMRGPNCQPRSSLLCAPA